MKPLRSHVPIWTEIVCRICSGTAAGQFTYGAVQRRSMVKAAKAAGWLFRHHEAFCTFVCLSKFEKEQRK